MNLGQNQEPAQGTPTPDTGEPQGQPPEQHEPTAGSEDFETAFESMMDAAGKRIAGQEPELDRSAAGQGTPPPSEGNPAQSTQGQEEAQPAPVKHKVKISGQDVELTVEEMAELASMGGDYTRKTMDLANKARQLDGFQSLIGMLQSDPDFAQHVFGYKPQGQAAPAAQEPPADPIERIKWEAKREARQEIMGEITPMANEVRAIKAQAQVNDVIGTLRTDPLHEQVKQGMLDYVNAQPPMVRERLAAQMDADMNLFLGVYGDIRQRVIQAASQRQGGASPQGQPPTPAQGQQQAQPQNGLRVVQKQAPQLEAPGAGSEMPDRRTQDLKTLSKRVRSGNVNAGDLGEYLRLTGALDRMSARAR